MSTVNLIKRILIENVKGKDTFEILFSELVANQPNIVVAPNGYGKSTLATAFKASENGRMKLDKRDYYQQNADNHPKLEIELIGEYAGKYISSDYEGNISSHMTLYTINSSLFAKSTTRGFDNNFTPTADLRLEQIVVYKKIPEKCELNYSYKKIVSDYGNKKKLFLNISKLLNNYNNISSLISIYACMNKCYSQKRVRTIFSEFLNSCSENGSALMIKSNILPEVIEKINANDNLQILVRCISTMEDLPLDWCEVDSIFTAIQICKMAPSLAELKKVEEYLQYKAIRKTIDERLQLFNTTGRPLKTQEQKGKLIINFERATSMSNGERDVLTFISKLSIFELAFKKGMGILLIDEVFDYLDGSNLLAVQYYLSQTINKCKVNGKILFPIILTHLDPAVFSNYYFNKKKIHYISAFPTFNTNSSIVRLLILREKEEFQAIKDEIERYYLHYINELHEATPELKSASGLNFSNVDFRNSLYDEIKNKYLSDTSSFAFDSIRVVAGVRIRIEEVVYGQLSEVYRPGFIAEHKVINKLNYAEQCGVNIPELYYLLQPLYNDSLHIRSDDEAIRKIKSCNLKTDNLHIRRMISKLFDE